MNIKDLPTLVDALHAELMDGAVHHEHALLKSCEHLSIFSLCSSDPTLGLFQKHFILMHALYFLRRDLFEAQVAFLEIEGTRARLLPWQSDTEAQQMTTYLASEKLETYYLDFSNVIRETECSVASMLGQFWRKYAEHAIVDASEKEAALAHLELDWPISEKTLKRAFRERALAVHPDRGGDPEDFIELRRSYDTLKTALRQSQNAR